ncbi:hypothetical protein BH09ACT4_BH09ACT4_07870 [soil metagenome]
MAESRSRRSTTGLVFIIAGALLVLAVALPLLGVTQVPWLVALAFLAITVALAVMGFGAVNSTLAKVALIAAAVGWAVLTLDAIGVGLPKILITIAAIVAGVAGLIAAIVLYVGKEIRNTPAIAFIVTAALGLLYLLGYIGTLAFGTLGVLIAVAFAVGLIITGVLFRRKESGRR